MSWVYCRWCKWELKPEQQAFGFHDRAEKKLYDKDRERVEAQCLEVFKKEGEPNFGRRS